MITKNIPVIDNEKLSKEIRKIINQVFGDDQLNAYQILYLEDSDDGSPIEIVTKYFRENGITGDKVLIDNTW